MIFEEYVKERRAPFVAKVIEISAYLEIRPEWLMFLMWFETAHTLDHRIRNKIGATGLIQFMPKTAIGLGTTTDALRAMSNVEQLEYVKKHLSRFKGSYAHWVDLYLAIFWPAGVGKPDTYTITADNVALMNPLFDLNGDKDITKSEIRQALRKQIPTKYQKFFV